MSLMPPRHGAAACRSDVERDLRLPYNKHFVALQEVWTMVRKGRAVWRGTGKDGTGDLTTDSGVLSHTPYSFKTRRLTREGGPGFPDFEVGTDPARAGARD